MLLVVYELIYRELDTYHDEDRVHTTLSDSGRNEFHHVPIAKMD